MNWQTLLQNPALITGAVRAILILLISFGVSVTQDQQDGIIMSLAAILAVVSALVTGATVALTTSATNPVVHEGTDITVVTPPDEPNRTITA